VGGVRNWFGWRERREGWPQRTNELATPHSTFVKAESTLSLLPFHRFLDASRRYPAREVVDFWVGPIPAGPGSIEEEDMEEALATEERADWGWEAEEGDHARIIRRAVDISNQTKRSKHGRTFPPSNDYDPSPACLRLPLLAPWR
jgi:hypothetical protein